MRVVHPLRRKRRQLAAELDDELVALHPVVEHAKLVADRGDRFGGGGLLGHDERIGHWWDVLIRRRPVKPSLLPPHHHPAGDVPGVAQPGEQQQAVATASSGGAAGGASAKATPAAISRK